MHMQAYISIGVFGSSASTPSVGSLGGNVDVLARARIPTASEFFMCGYAERAIVRSGRLGPDLRLMPKPFDPDDLARQVRMAFDA